MSASPRLYQLIADVVRAHSGSEALVDEIHSFVLDEIDGHVAARFDEELNTSRIPFDSSRRGHTEEQAAQRWCPHVREVTPLGKSKKDVQIGNRYLGDEGDYTNPAGCRCIASNCMAWRWETELHGRCGLAGPAAPMPANEPCDLPDRVPPARLGPSPPQLDLFPTGAVDRRRDSAGSSIEAAAKELPMPTKDDMFPSKYLKAADLNGRPVILEIASAPQEVLTGADGRQDRKTVLYFTRTNKKLPLNRVNWDAVVDVTGEADSDHWPGHKIELFPATTEMQGKVVPCIRIRTPKVRPTMAKPSASSVAGDLDDAIPDFDSNN